MSEYLTIEPAPEQRGPFAVWALAKDPQVQTVGTGGFVVPLDWYPEVPSELLVGSYVDGFAYDRSAPQPEALAAEARVPLVDRLPVTQRKPLTAEQKPTPKKRAPRKRAPRKPKAEDAP